MLDSLISSEKLLWGQVTPSVVFLIQRTEPFGDEPQGKEFATLSALYRTLAISEAVNHEIVTISDAEPEGAIEIVRQWISTNASRDY